MFSRIRFSKEEVFLYSVIFESQIEKSLFFEINFDKIVKLASKHLLLPVLYSKLKKRGYISRIPVELTKYLGEIYEINKNRNRILLEEISDLSNVLNKMNINHVFIKGSALLLNNIFENLGDRMVGDIDILVSKKDFKRCYEFFENIGYCKKKEDSNFERFARHYPRLTNKKKLFAIELHKKILYPKYEYLLDPHLVLVNKNKVKNNISIPSDIDLFKNSIYSFQINDFGFHKAHYSYKSLLDSISIVNSLGIKVDNLILNDKFSLGHLKILKALNIGDFKIKNQLSTNFFMLRVSLKKNYVFFSFLDFVLSHFFLNLYIRTFQIIEFLSNKNYKKYVIKKLFK